MATDLSSITFVDFQEPEDELCELLYICLLDSISTYTALYSGSGDDEIDSLVNTVESIHNCIDVFLLTLSDLFETALAIEYLISHDGTSFVFSPGNHFTGKVSAKMDELQVEDSIRFNTYI